MNSPVGVRSRAQTTTLIVGISSGMLIAGLLVPFIFGERTSESEGATAEVSTFGESAGTTPSVGSENPGAATSTPGAGDSGSSSVPGAGSSRLPETSASSAAQSEFESKAPAPTEQGPLTATDVGVTKDSIKIGFLIVDLGSTGRLGVETGQVDGEKATKMVEAFVADLNARGGINGRKVLPHYRKFDPLNPEDGRAACLEMTEDEKVFAVVAYGFGGIDSLCVSAEHRTPLFNTGEATPGEYIAKANGMLIITNMAGDRLMANWVDQLTELDLIKNRKLGVLADQSDATVTTTKGALLPELARQGHKVLHTTYLSEDPSTAAGQIPTEITKMRQAGVDTVLINTQFINGTQWVQAADAQGWRPRYLISEWLGLTSDFEVEAMPASFDGAMAMTNKRYHEFRSNLPEPPQDARCRTLYEEHTGKSLPRNDGDEARVDYNGVLQMCGVTQVFAAAVTAAGTNLTRQAVSVAAQNLGSFTPAFYLGGSFRPGKVDLADNVRWIRFHGDCKCWRIPDTTVRSVKFK